MKLTDFEESIDADLLERGEHYYETGRIKKLSESDDGFWTAEVQGTQKYTVRAELDGKYIRSWHCTCPYDFGPVCKHVIAVLLAIREQKQTPVKDKKQKKTLSESDMIGSILETASKEDLTGFLNRHMAKCDTLSGELLAYFSDRIECDQAEKYETIVKNLISNARMDDDYMSYYAMSDLGDSLYQLITKAEHLEKQKQYEEVCAICQALIRQVPGINEYADDSGGETMTVIESAFELLRKLGLKAGIAISDRCFDFCVEEYPDKKYHDYGFDSYFLSLIPELVRTPEQEKTYFKLIDSAVKRADKESFSGYGVIRLLGSKIDYLLKAKKENEALAIIREHLRYPEIRMRLVDRAVRRKEYGEAKSLSDEGLQLAEKEKHTGTAITWMEKLLEIAGLEGDMAVKRRWTRALFYRNHGNIVYYKKLKRLYTAEAWPAERDTIISPDSHSKSAGKLTEDTLAGIFVEECMFDRLLALLRVNHTHIHFVDRYAGHIKDIYPAETVALYESLIRQIVPNTGRGIYEQIAGYMKKMKKIKGGNERVQELKREFQVQYKNRKAMMSIIAVV